jgi:hypothetical protein
VTVAHRLASDAVTNMTFDSETDYFVARSAVQAAIGQALEMAAQEVMQALPNVVARRTRKQVADRIRAIADKPAQRDEA